MTEATQTEEAQNEDQRLVEFNPVRAQIKKAKEENAKLSFNVNDDKELDAAKKHVKHLKSIRKKVEETHKKVKAEALQFGRDCDSVKRELMADMNEMIDLHEGPIKQKKADEEARIQKHLENVKALQLPEVLPNTSAELKKLQTAISETTIDESWEEYEKPAATAKKLSLDLLKPKIEWAEKQEANERELAELRQKEAEREAEAKAEAERIREEERKRIEAENEERREKEKQEAIEQAKKDEAERIEREQKEKEEADRKAEEQRKADETHKNKIMNQMFDVLSEIGLTDEDADTVTKALVEGKIPHTVVQF